MNKLFRFLILIMYLINYSSFIVKWIWFIIIMYTYVYQIPKTGFLDLSVVLRGINTVSVSR